MARQGRLRQRIPSCCAHPTALRLLCALTLITIQLADTKTASAQDISGLVDVNLRLHWESPEPQHCRFEIRIQSNDAESLIGDVQNHSGSQSIAGSLELLDTRTLIANPRHAVDTGDVVFRIRAPRQSKLMVSLRTDSKPGFADTTPSQNEIVVSELLSQEKIEGSHNATTWSLARAEADELRIEGLSTKFYAPGAPLEIGIRAQDFVRHASQVLTLKYSLHRVSHDEVVATHRWPLTIDPFGNSEPVSVQEPAPTMPGVYEVRCELIQSDEDIWSRIRRREATILRIGRPIVVHQAKDASSEAPLEAWETIGVIRPSESSWSVGQWLPKQTTRLIPGVTSTIEQPELETKEYDGQAVSLIQPGKSFQATLPVMTPGFPHQVTIRFPARWKTKLRVDVGQAERREQSSSFVISQARSVEAKDGWRTHTFLHYPAGDDQIWLENLDDQDTVGLDSVTVQAGPHRLDAEPRLNPFRRAVLRLNSFDWVDTFSADVPDRCRLVDYNAETIALYRLWTATLRVQDHARINGMNSVLLPVASATRSWFETDSFHPQTRDNERHRLQQFLQWMQDDNLSVFVGISPSMPFSKVESVIRSNTSMARTLIRRDDAVHDQYNYLHPVIQEQLVKLVNDLHQACIEYPNYAGVVLDCGSRTHLQPIATSPESTTVQDSTSLALFAQANRRIVSPQLEAWVAGEGKNEFLKWIDSESGRVLTSLASAVPDHSLILEGTAGFQSEIDQASNLLMSTTFNYSPADVIDCPQHTLQRQLSNAFTNQSSPARAVILRRETRDSNGQAHAELVREQVIFDASRIADRISPEVLVMDHGLLATSVDQDLAKMLRSFTSMPTTNAKQIEPIDPAAGTVRVATVSHDGYFYVSITNLAPWQNDVDLECSQVVQWTIAGGHNSDLISSHDNRARVHVPAGQIVVLRSEEPAADVAIKSWLTRVSGGGVALEQIKRQVTLIVENIGVLSDLKPSNALINGGFEKSSGMGLVGWLHAQHPPGCVQLDDQEASEGTYSVRLTTDDSATSRTWLVSETLEPPKSGRLAVSLSCRAEKTKNASIHQVRVSIEATRNGAPVRYSSEFEVPRNGQWGDRAIVLESEDVGPSKVEAIRLTIDSLSGGRVWIDDVQLHDQFPTSTERAELQRLAFLAVQGLQRGNLTSSARLLQNDWARHLLAMPGMDKPKPTLERVKTPDEAPGVADRIRSWLPRPLRF